jgi:AraC-like DNA-binding protein
VTAAPPTHDAVWVRQLAAELAQRGYPASGLLAAAGIEERSLADDRARVPLAGHAAFFELAAEATRNSRLGLDFGQARDTRDAGLIGYVGLSSPTLRDALRNLARYRRVFSDAVEIDAGQLEACGRLRWWFHGLARGSGRQCVEFSAVNLVRALREMAGERFALRSVDFVHSRDEGLAPFDAFFGCPVRFRAEENAVVLGQDDLARPIRSADDRLLAVLRRYCEEVISRHAERAPALVERVERVITNGLPQGKVSLSAVASTLGMSTRSLARRLAEHETSFMKLVENLRRDLALRYLEETTLGLTEIAFLLGYSEVSSFNHAFRRWTGKTPSSVRLKIRSRAAIPASDAPPPPNDGHGPMRWSETAELPARPRRR